MVGLATPDKTQRVVVVPQHFDDVLPLSGPLYICGWNFLGPVKKCILTLMSIPDCNFSVLSL